MSQHSRLYEVSRISGTIGAGIFTGLAFSAPLYSLPTISSFSPSKSAKEKTYNNKDQKLSPHDRLTLFQTVHETTGAVAIPVAGISGLFFAIAAYVAPAAVAYNPAYLAKGAGEIGSRYASDAFLTRATAPRALLIGSSLALFSIIPISSLISQKAARDAISLSSRLSNESVINAAGVSTSESERQLDKKLAAWTGGIQLASLVGFLATLAGALQLAGYAP